MCCRNISNTVDLLANRATNEARRVQRKYQRRAQMIHAGEIKYGINTGLRRTHTPPAAQALRLLDMCMDREHKRRDMCMDRERRRP